jgi:hypothetical protein
MRYIMENKLTHLKYRQAIKNHDDLILTGLRPKGMKEEDFHASRKEMYLQYDLAEKIFEFMKDLDTRKSYNPSFNIRVLSRLIEQKCGVEAPDGVIIAAMLARGFKCNWKDDIRFNVSSSSKALQ